MPWFNKSSRKRKTKRRVIKKRGFINPEYLIFLFKKIGIWVALIVALFWFGSWFFLSDASNKTYQWSQNKIFSVTQSSGYQLENILVTGRNYTPASSIKSAINLQKGDALLSFNPKQAQDILLQENWIENVTVKRILPDTISVKIIERIPMALWQKDKKLSLIDSNGNIITDQNLGSFKDLIILTGEAAPQFAPTLLSYFQAVPDIFYRIETANFISKRRWDVVLKNGTLIKLPEDNVPLALSSLEKLNAKDKILESNLDFIDVRDLKRITIKTKPGTVQKYDTGYSDYSKDGDRI